MVLTCVTSRDSRVLSHTGRLGNAEAHFASSLHAATRRRNQPHICCIRHSPDTRAITPIAVSPWLLITRNPCGRRRRNATCQSFWDSPGGGDVVVSEGFDSASKTRKRMTSNMTAQRLVFPGKQKVLIEEFRSRPAGKRPGARPHAAFADEHGDGEHRLQPQFRSRHSLGRLGQISRSIPATRWWAIVEEIGEGVATLKPGQRVAYRNGHRSHDVVDAEKCFHPIPDEVSFEQAAWFALGKITFHGALAAGYQLGDSVLVIGAGPIGQMTIRWARAAGAAKIIVVDTADHPHAAGEGWRRDRAGRAIDHRGAGGRSSRQGTARCRDWSSMGPAMPRSSPRHSEMAARILAGWSSSATREHPPSRRLTSDVITARPHHHRRA